MKRKIVIPSKPRPAPANDAAAPRERRTLGVKFGQAGEAEGSGG